MLRIIRKSSETPNVSNRDDTCMARYAYGGYNGIVKNYGCQLSASIDSSQNRLTVGSGRVVIQGWEVDIEDHELQLETPFMYPEVQFLYAEINLLQEVATFKILSSEDGTLPETGGDDLTQNTSGTARIALWKWSASSSGFGDPERVAPIIRHLQEIYAELDDRLTRLGFREGEISLEFSPGSWIPGIDYVEINWVQREGNLVIGRLNAESDTALPSTEDYTLSDGNSYTVRHIATLSPEFCPTELYQCWGEVFSHTSIGIYSSFRTTIRIDTDGRVFMTAGDKSDFSVAFAFGYRANPIKGENEWITEYLSKTE